jgi:antitoxin (DNA-binding transcriptional repressor) of toxin-antitoxin stability system
MKAVGIKRLKARLSEYVRYVRGGETILITERDEVVAELRPARNRRVATSDIEETLERLEEAGELSRASLPKKGWAWTARGAGLPEGTTKELLNELRADRFSD